MQAFLLLLDCCMPEMNGGMAAVRLKNAQPDVAVALLSSDECLPAVDLQAVDCLMPKSEPITNFLGKIDYLLSLCFLFQPFVVSKLRTPEGAGRSTTHETWPSLGQIEWHLYEK